MPSIKKNTDQELALQEITDALGSIRSLNQVLVPGWGGDVSINFTVGKGKNGTFRIPFGADETKEMTRVVAIASSYKSKLVRDIKAKAAKFQISLDEEDVALMNGDGNGATEPGPTAPKPPKEKSPEPGKDSVSTDRVSNLDTPATTSSPEPEGGSTLGEEDLAKLLEQDTF